MVNFRNSLVAGETLNASVCHPSATVINAIFVGPGKFTLPFEKDGETWKVSADTAEWPAGIYVWQLWIEAPAGKSMGGTGKITVGASLATLEGGVDNRTVAQKNIEAIEAMLTGKAGNTVKRYRINNRELENYPITELLTLLDYWKRVRRSERRRNRPLGPNLRVSL